MNKLCQCGCGQEIVIKQYILDYPERYPIPKFIQGHHVRTLEIREKIFANWFKKGHKINKERWQTEMTRKKISEKTKENMKNPELKEKIKDFWNSPRGEKAKEEIRMKSKERKHSEETRLILSIKNTGKISHRRGISLEQEYGEEKSKGIRKKMSENHWDSSKENHPLWQGGKSFEPYGIDFNKKIKMIIKERDGCCMLCNVSFDDLKLLKRKIHIHHINYDKLCNFVQNLVALCHSCHTKTNFNRRHWQGFFQSLLSERYEYKYSEDGKIILELMEEK